MAAGEQLGHILLQPHFGWWAHLLRRLCGAEHDDRLGSQLACFATHTTCPLWLHLSFAQAMEARRKERERPWLRLLAITTAASTVLLAAVLWRLEHMP